MAEVTARNAPAAYGGGLFISKFSVSSASCPETVAFSDGVAVAASISSVYLEATSALAAPSINSPSCIFLCIGFSNIAAVPCAASKSDTLLFVVSAAIIFARGSSGFIVAATLASNASLTSGVANFVVTSFASVLVWARHR